MGVHALEQSGRKIARKATVEEERMTGGRRRGMGSAPPRAALFIRGSTESARYGSFRRTTRLNGSFANGLQLRSKSVFRLSAKQKDNTRSS
jgi:hypothetical protein